MKVIGIKGNYKCDNAQQPQVYLMADSSLLKDGKPLFLPDFAEEFVAHPALVVRINRLGKNIAKRFASRYYDAVTVGLCVEACGFRNLQKLAGTHSVVNAFDGAAILGDFIEMEHIDDINNLSFSITQNESEVATINSHDLLNDVDSLIEELSKYFTFKIGDILFTGYREDISIKLNINDLISSRMGDNTPLHFKVK